MKRIEHRIFSRKQGLPPGTLFDSDMAKLPGIRHIRYSTTSWEANEFESVESLPMDRIPGSVDWIQIFGTGNSKVLAEIGRRYGIHKLTLEDIQNTDRRLGFEDQDDYLFFTLKRLKESGDADLPGAETISLILKDSLVITFHSEDSDGYEIILDRMENNQGRIRRSGASYLAYALMDESIDTWLGHSETIENKILEIEENVLFHYQNDLILQIHRLKKHLAWLRWLFRPYRDLNLWLFRDGAKWFPADVQPYLSDVSDHVSRVLDTLELYRDMTEDLLTVHMTALSNRMNSIMKVLTIISTIFIPLTFLAGIYGMNFHWMPELAWRWGYPLVLGAMGLITSSMILYFSRKKWL